MTLSYPYQPTVTVVADVTLVHIVTQSLQVQFHFWCRELFLLVQA